MNEAMDQAIERLALRLVMRRDMGSATPQTEDDARRLVQCWTDGHRRGGNVAHDALSEYVNEAKALIRGLGLVIVPPELVTALPPSRSASGCSGPCDEGGMCARCNAKLNIADAVLEQLRDAQ